MGCGYTGSCTTCPYDYCIDENEKEKEPKPLNLSELLKLPYEKSRYKRKKAAGLCYKCSNPSRPGKALCEACSKRQVEANRKYKLKRRELLKGKD